MNIKKATPGSTRVVWEGFTKCTHSAFSQGWVEVGSSSCAWGYYYWQDELTSLPLPIFITGNQVLCQNKLKQDLVGGVNKIWMIGIDTLDWSSSALRTFLHLKDFIDLFFSFMGSSTA